MWLVRTPVRRNGGRLTWEVRRGLSNAKEGRSILADHPPRG